MLTLRRWTMLGCSLAALTGCVVPKTQYEEARSAVRVENAAHRRTQARLYDTEQRANAAEVALAERDRRIAILEQHVAQSTLDWTLASGERDRAAQLVEQLRIELGRVGEHLEAYVEEKQALAAALRSAEERAKRLAEVERDAATRARLVRDVTLVLRGPIERGDGEIAVEDGRPIVRIDEAMLFVGDAIAPDARTLLHQIGRTVGAAGTARIELGQRGGSRPPEELIVRLTRVADALAEEGLSPDRVEVTLPAARSAPPPTDPNVPLPAETAQVEIAIFSSPSE